MDRRHHTGQHPGHYKQGRVANAIGDPLFNALGDWIQRLDDGKTINMGQWRPREHVPRGDMPGQNGPIIPQMNVNNKVQANVGILKVNKDKERNKKPGKSMYPDIPKDLRDDNNNEDSPGGGDLEDSARPPSSVTPVGSQEMTPSKECAARGVLAERSQCLHKAHRGTAYIRAGVSSAVKWLLETLKKSLCATALVCLVMTGAVLLIRELGWLALHSDQTD